MDIDTYKQITARINEAVNCCNKSKKQIAQEIGIAPPTLSQYLSGRVMPSIITLKKLCESTDTSADFILAIDWDI